MKLFCCVKNLRVRYLAVWTVLRRSWCSHSGLQSFRPTQCRAERVGLSSRALGNGFIPQSTRTLNFRPRCGRESGGGAEKSVRHIHPAELSDIVIPYEIGRAQSCKSLGCNRLIQPEYLHPQTRLPSISHVSAAAGCPLRFSEYSYSAIRMDEPATLRVVNRVEVSGAAGRDPFTYWKLFHR